MEMGTAIKRLRIQNHLTQQGFADALGCITAQGISSWENNRCLPDVAVLPKIARIFGVSIDELYGIEKEVPKAEQPNAEAAEEDDTLHIPFLEDGICNHDPLRAVEELYDRFIRNEEQYDEIEEITDGMDTDEKHIPTKDEMLAFQRAVLNECCGASERTEALRYACDMLDIDGYKDNAIYLAQYLPKEIKEEAYLDFYENGEKFERRKKKILEAVRSLLYQLCALTKDSIAEGLEALNDEERLVVFEKSIGVARIMFENGDFNEVSLDVCEAYLEMAKIYAGRLDRDNTMKILTEFGRCFDRYLKCPSYEKHSSTAFRGCPIQATEKPSSTGKAVKDAVTEVFKCRLEDRCFDFVRGEAEFPLFEVEE